MPRINIEESLWRDNRFQDLLILVKNRHIAKGMILELWIVAQKFWLASKGCGIPKPAWEKEGLPNELIQAGLARDDGEFVYAIGSKEQFAWMDAASAKGKFGGPAAAKSRVENKGKLKRPKSSQHVPARPSTSSISTSFSASASTSASCSDSKDKILYSVGAQPPLALESVKSPIGFFIANYVNAYQLRYGMNARPALSGKVQGQIKRFLSDTPLERACQLAQTYLQMNDAWFVTKAHDFGTFVENLSKIGLALDTGKSATQTEARNLDRKQSNYNAFAHLIDDDGKESPA